MCQPHRLSSAVVDMQHHATLNQPTKLAPGDMLELSFEEAVKHYSCCQVVKTMDTTGSTMIQQQQLRASPVSNTGKELWQSLAQSRSPSYTKAADSGADSSSSKGTKVGSTAASVTKDGSESGDGNTSATSDTVVTKQTKSVMERTPETGAGDAKSATTEETVSLSGWAGWQTADRESPVKPDDESFSSSLESVPVEPGDVSGEESFYSVTSNDQHLVPQSQPAAEPADDEDDDDDGDVERGDADDDAADVNQAQVENGTHSDVAFHCWLRFLCS